MATVLDLEAKRFSPILLLIVFALSGSTNESACHAQAASLNKNLPRAEQTEGLIADGIAAFERNDMALARNYFERALTLEPASVAAHTYLGFIADRSGDLQEAERQFSAASKSAPSLAAARNNHGAILLRLGQVAPAAAEFEASLKLDHNQPNALVNLAQIRFSSGTPADLRQADNLFSRAYSLAPDVEIARALTVVSLRRQDHAMAATRYREYAARVATDNGTTAGTAADRSELGAALLEAGLLEQAEAELTAALALDPSNQESVVRLARVYVARKDLPAAGKTLEAAVARGMEAAPVFALLSEVYEQTGHPENAIPAMRLAIQHDPESEKYRFAYGMLLTNVYAPAAAAIRLEEALKSFPNSSNLWFALGLAYFKNEKREEAESAFKHSIELNGNFAPAYAYRGMIRVQAGNYAEGISLYEKALQLNPKISVVHYLIADALLRLPDTNPSAVETHLKRAIESDPTFVPARLTLGKLYMRAERWLEAANQFEQVIKLDPDVAESHYQLGRAYMRLKRTADAQAAMATFKTLSASQKELETKELRDIVKRLAEVRF